MCPAPEGEIAGLPAAAVTATDPMGAELFTLAAGFFPRGMAYRKAFSSHASTSVRKSWPSAPV
jgi:hypothetical protein